MWNTWNIFEDLTEPAPLQPLVGKWYTQSLAFFATQADHGKELIMKGNYLSGHFLICWTQARVGYGKGRKEAREFWKCQPHHLQLFWLGISSYLSWPPRSSSPYPLSEVTGMGKTLPNSRIKLCWNFTALLLSFLYLEGVLLRKSSTKEWQSC